MENASKALIIAGAILLAILIISLGIAIYGQAAGVVNNNAMSELEIQQFNQKFTQYEGERVRGATINAMLQSVLANNTSADDNDRKVSVTLDGSTILAKNDNNIKSTASIKTGAIYKVKCTMGTTGGNKGLVDIIAITKVVNN